LGSWNGSVLGVQTLMEQFRAEMHFRLRCYRTPVPGGAGRGAELEALAARAAIYATRARGDGTRRVYRSAWRGYEACLAGDVRGWQAEGCNVEVVPLARP
jgi:hypothetical protein